MAFKRATREKAKLRMGIAGPSGSGKTFTALAIASGLDAEGSVALIDSEQGSSLFYSNQFVFDQDDLSTFDPLEYVKKIQDAGKAGYSVLIIDSLSHAWQKILEEVDQVAARKFKGNTWSAWSDVTPRLYRPLINAILAYPGHIIVTFRSKTQTAMELDGNGKNQVRKVGTKIEQKENIEYEFTMFMEMNVEGNVGYFSKDRTGLFFGKYVNKPGREIGEAIRADLESGSEPVRVRTYDEPPLPQSLDYGKQEPANSKKRSALDAVTDAVNESIAALDIARLQTVSMPGITKLHEEKKITEETFKKCEKLITDGISKIAQILMMRESEKKQPAVETPKVANPNLDSNGKALEVLF